MAQSEALDKRLWHKRFRALAREDIEATDKRLVSDPWSMVKDGKRWWGKEDLQYEWCVYKDKPYKFWTK